MDLRLDLRKSSVKARSDPFQEGTFGQSTNQRKFSLRGMAASSKCSAKASGWVEQEKVACYCLLQLYKYIMWMGYIKSSAGDVLNVLAKLDQVVPSWRWANEDHVTLCTLTRLRALELQLADKDYPVEVWVLIPNKTESMMARLSFNFVEFGEAEWSSTRQVRNAYQYSGNGTAIVPGYIIS